ncbi:MAG: hypothetical protein AAF546_03215, partial [Verrucomicrobiota bacterium]
AVSKISGASLSDGKYVVIRGLNDRYNTTLINGVVLPSPDPDRKAVALDIFPTSLFDNIIARKTFTADMPGESSGGSIELVTKSIPDEPFVKFSFGLGGQITSSETDTFLSDPEQVSLGEWLTGDDNRGFSLTPGTTLLANDYPTNVGGVSFPRTGLGSKKLSSFGDRSYGLSMGGSKEINDTLTIGGILGLKLSEKRRTSFKEGVTNQIEEGNVIVDEVALASEGGGILKSEEEYNFSILAGIGAKIGEKHTLNYSFLSAETLTSTVEQKNYQEYVEGAPRLINIPSDVDPDLLPLPDNAFYNYLDLEIGSEERLLQAHQFSGEHFFDFLFSSDLGLTWYYTDARMEQSEPDQRLIAEYFTDYRVFSADPGLEPITRYQRETEQDSRMYGFQADQEIELSNSITLGIKLGYDYEESDRDFFQLETQIFSDEKIDDLDLAAMPFPNTTGLNGAVDEENGIFLYNEDFFGLDNLITNLYESRIEGESSNLNTEAEKLVRAQADLDAAEALRDTDQGNLDSSINGFETNFGIDYETEFDPTDPTQQLFFEFFIEPNEEDLAISQANVAVAEDELAAAQEAFDIASEPLNILISEQAAYRAQADAFIAQIASMPALATDLTAFPTFSFDGDQNYILDTPQGFSLFADETPTSSNIQFNTVTGQYRVEGESNVESFFVSGDLEFDDVLFFQSIKIGTGLRRESTELSYILLENPQGEPDTISFTAGDISPVQVVPSMIDQSDNLYYVAATFQVNDSLRIQLSKSTTVAKPTFREIAPFPSFNLTDGSVEVGNSGLALRSDGRLVDWTNRTGDFAGVDDSELPEFFVVPVEFAGLDIADVENQDIRIEYFTPLDGLISVGYFQKDIGAPIERVLAYQANGIDVNTFINNDNDAELEGFEFELEQNLGIFGETLLGIPLGWITIGGNYTLIDAEVTRSQFEQDNLTNERFDGRLIEPNAFQADGRHGTRPLYDQPDYVANAFITFDIEPTGTRITFSHSWLGQQLTRAGSIGGSLEGRADQYLDDFGALNLVIEQELSENWKLRFSAKNINSPDRTVFEDTIFYDALQDPAQKFRIESDPDDDFEFAPRVTGLGGSLVQTVEPSFSISISGSF